jgi:transposase
MDSHKRSTQLERLEVVETGRRRRWSDDEKLRIVTESFQAPRAISSTARRHGISRSLLMTWRRAFGPEPISPQGEQSGFARVVLAAGSSGDCRCRRRFGRPGAGAAGSGASMIPISSSARIWIATGYTDMRKGMQGLSLLVQESLGRDPFAGDVFVFRGRSGSLIKALWHDGIGLSLYAKRLDRGRFVWPVTVGGVVGLTGAQMSYLLEAIDWRNPQHTWRPQSAG